MKLLINFDTLTNKVSDYISICLLINAVISVYDADRTGKETLQIKRKKTLASFYSMISFARAQKDTTKAKELQNMIDAYENERRTMEEKYSKF